MKRITIDYIDFIKMWNTLYCEHKNEPVKRVILEKLKHKVFLENELYKDEIYMDEEEKED